MAKPYHGILMAFFELLAGDIPPTTQDVMHLTIQRAKENGEDIRIDDAMILNIASTLEIPVMHFGKVCYSAQKEIFPELGLIDTTLCLGSINVAVDDIQCDDFEDEGYYG